MNNRSNLTRELSDNLQELFNRIISSKLDMNYEEWGLSEAQKKLLGERLKGKSFREISIDMNNKVSTQSLSDAEVHALFKLTRACIKMLLSKL
jgi:hypothetical protein